MVTANLARLTPIEIGQGVTYKEAELTFPRKKCISINFPKRILQLKFRSIMLPCQKSIQISMEAGNHILFLLVKL